MKIRATPGLIAPLDVRDPDGFVDRLDEAIAGGLAPLALKSVTGAEIIAAAETV